MPTMPLDRNRGESAIIRNRNEKRFRELAAQCANLEIELAKMQRQFMSLQELMFNMQNREQRIIDYMKRILDLQEKIDA